jgi:predicted TIM-barrel fold metal-dependent hydrolase
MIVQIHTQDMKGLIEMADRHPDTPFVLAHMGGNADHIGRVQAVASRKNIYIDISGSDVSRAGILEAYIREAGVEKVLFATDYIVCEPVVYIARIKGLGLPTQDEEKVFWRNAQGLLEQRA